MARRRNTRPAFGVKNSLPYPADPIYVTEDFVGVFLQDGASL